MPAESRVPQGTQASARIYREAAEYLAHRGHHRAALVLTMRALIATVDTHIDIHHPKGPRKR